MKQNFINFSSRTPAAVQQQQKHTHRLVNKQTAHTCMQPLTRHEQTRTSYQESFPLISDSSRHLTVRRWNTYITSFLNEWVSDVIHFPLLSPHAIFRSLPRVFFVMDSDSELSCTGCNCEPRSIYCQLLSHQQAITMFVLHFRCATEKQQQYDFLMDLLVHDGLTSHIVTKSRMQLDNECHSCTWMTDSQGNTKWDAIEWVSSSILSAVPRYWRFSLPVMMLTSKGYANDVFPATAAAVWLQILRVFCSKVFFL
jgi:hypothetical protein